MKDERIREVTLRNIFRNKDCFRSVFYDYKDIFIKKEKKWCAKSLLRKKSIYIKLVKKLRID